MAITVLIGVMAPPASAETGGSCLAFEQGLELDDGSVVAAGTGCIAKFGPSGGLEPGFGSGGTAAIGGDSADSGEQIVDLLELPDGFLVVRPDSLTKFTENGAPDPSFGDNGSLRASTLIPFTNRIGAATADQGGNIFFQGVQGQGGRGSQTIAKLKPSGDLDPSFGEGGIYWEESPDIQFYVHQLELDGEGRLLAAGDATQLPTLIRAGLVRLTATGEVDTSFGTMGVAEAEPIPNAPTCQNLCSVRISGISIGSDQHVTLLGSVDYVYVKSGNRNTYWAEFGPDGDPTATSSFTTSTTAPALLEFPDGDLLLNESAGRRARPDGSAIPGWQAFDGSRLAEFGFDAGTVSYNPVTGHLLSAGTLRGTPTCLDPRYHCPSTRGAVTKIDAQTGEVIRPFGGTGTAMVGPNECAAGTAPQLDGYGPWRRCALASPSITANAKIGKARTRHPNMRLRVVLGSPPEHPLFLNQMLRVKLPGNLRLNKKRLRSKIEVKTKSEAPGSFRTSVKGRTLTIRFTPEVYFPEGYDDVYYVGDPPAPNGKTEAVIKLKRGALRAIPKRLRGRRVKVVASGRVSAQMPSTIPWWGPSDWSRETARVRVP